MRYDCNDLAVSVNTLFVETRAAERSLMSYTSEASTWCLENESRDSRLCDTVVEGNDIEKSESRSESRRDVLGSGML